MHFDVGTVRLEVNEKVPALNDLPLPGSLRDLSNRELSDFITELNGDNSTAVAARDWTNIRERMKYVVQFFRVMHLEPEVFAEPYTLMSSETSMFPAA